MKGTILASIFCLVLLAGCSNSEGKAEPTAVSEKKVEKELTQEEKDKKFAENVASASTLDEAVSRAAPKLGVEFQDKEKDSVSLGASGLIWWAQDHLVWSSFDKIPSTTYNEFRKDPFSEKGKKICADVRVSEIYTIRDKDNVSYFATLVDRKLPSQFYQAVLLKSTKNIVEGSKVRFCGIALENYQYKNIAAKYTNSIFIVGILDIPTNK
ncbi:hypothetical protein [Acinetobacter tandoii]|uniref:Lipoprotein n=1 Tax=Acinetobacter tandoii DSM 14970 = CIP 107469 TaxID=1120927 RepID=R9AYF5_9GAMM|nr:hypothetical protein [Acinetobacter tandoii]EOR07269.1 hypothetical protein I593_02156 [Acinetobacter tandoii DSM 14970 = CIP 107469]